MVCFRNVFFISIQYEIEVLLYKSTMAMRLWQMIHLFKLNEWKPYKYNKRHQSHCNPYTLYTICCCFVSN